MKLIAVLLAAALLSSVPLFAQEQPDPAQAKITKNQAEHIALQKVPGGRVREAKLMISSGKLVWSLDIVKRADPSPEVVTVIRVDAISGRIAEEAKKNDES